MVANKFEQDVNETFVVVFFLPTEMDFQLDRVEGYQKYIASHHFWQITGYSRVFLRVGTLSVRPKIPV